MSGLTFSRQLTPQAVAGTPDIGRLIGRLHFAKIMSKGNNIHLIVRQSREQWKVLAEEGLTEVRDTIARCDELIGRAVEGQQTNFLLCFRRYRERSAAEFQAARLYR
jgi:hypothetical protein